MENYYTTLEIAEDASASDIRAAYRRLALQWHPDKNPTNREEATTKFKQISAAYEVLSDPTKRAAYDGRGTQNQFNRAYTPPEFNFFQSGSGGQRFGPDQFQFGFSFRSAEDIFKDFFRDDPFIDNDFGAGFGGGLFGSGAGAGTSIFFNQQMTQPGGTSFSMSSSSRREVINGKTTETRTQTVNGVQTTEVYENGVLVSSNQRSLGGGNSFQQQQPMLATTTSTRGTRSKPKKYRHHQ